MRWISVLVVGALVGCGAAQESGGEQRTFLEQWQAQLPEARESASEYERELIADDVVSREEHEDAIVRHLACLTAANVQVIRFERAPTGMIAALDVAGPESESAAQIAECEAEFYDLAREGFRATTLNPDGTEAERVDALATCLREAGVADVPDDPSTFAEIEAVIPTGERDSPIGQADAEALFEQCVAAQWY